MLMQTRLYPDSGPRGVEVVSPFKAPSYEEPFLISGRRARAGKEESPRGLGAGKGRTNRAGAIP